MAKWICGLTVLLGACSTPAPSRPAPTREIAEARISATQDAKPPPITTATEEPSTSPAPPKYDPAAFADVIGPPCEKHRTPGTVASRTDRSLGEAYAAYREDKNAGPDAGISVSMRFCGKLAPILAMGLTINSPVWEPGSIMVIVRYADLPRIVTDPGVVFLAAGDAPDLD